MGAVTTTNSVGRGLASAVRAYNTKPKLIPSARLWSLYTQGAMTYFARLPQGSIPLIKPWGDCREGYQEGHECSALDKELGARALPS